MSIGWVKLHRKIQDSWVWSKDKEFSKGQAWIDILLTVNHKDKKVLIGNEFFHVKAGESICSIKTWSERWGWSRSKVRRFLELLEKDSMINFKTNNKTTHLSICNWDTYQDTKNNNEHQTNIKRTSNEHQTNTNKNVKNDKNTIVTAIADDVPNASDFETWQSSIRVAEHLLDSICEYDPTHKYNHNPPSIAGWVKDIDLALRRDKRTEEQMVFLIDAIFKHPHRFPDLWDKWATNIESGGKLRSKFDQIKNQIRSNGKSTNQKIAETERFLNTYQHG